jgi:hypothetical protein
MSKIAKNWTQKVIDLCAPLSGTQVEELQQQLPSMTNKRVALALNIALHRRKLTAEKAEKNTQVEPLISLVTEQIPEPVVEEPQPPAPPVTAPRPRKKVNFSAVSLDDASSLLSAFGGMQTETPEPQTDKS